MELGDWVHEIGIPCFRPHTRRRKDGTVLYVVTAAELPEIAANSAHVTADLHGDKPPITEGHRNFGDIPEADQPLVLGYVDNFRCGTLEDGTPAILCDRHYMAQHAERATRHPFASVDYLPQRKAIVGLAKLTRPPELNLGGVYYPGTTEPVYVYAMGSPMNDMNQTADDLTPEEQAGSEKVYRYLMSKYKWFGTCAKKYEAGDMPAPAAPQANNTAMPDDDDKKKMESPTGMAADVKRYEAELAAAKSQLASLIAEREREKVGRLLDTLESVERYQFDRSAEEERMLALTQVQRDRRAEEIRKYHSRLPGSELQIEVYRGSVEGPAAETSQELANKAVKLASNKGISYDAALAELKSR